MDTHLVMLIVTGVLGFVVFVVGVVTGLVFRVADLRFRERRVAKSRRVVAERAREVRRLIAEHADVVYGSPYGGEWTHEERIDDQLDIA